MTGCTLYLGECGPDKARDLSQEDRERLWAMVTWWGGRVAGSLGHGVSHVVCALPVGDHYTRGLAMVSTEPSHADPDTTAMLRREPQWSAQTGCRTLSRQVLVVRRLSTTQGC